MHSIEGGNSAQNVVLSAEIIHFREKHTLLVCVWCQHSLNEMRVIDSEQNFLSAPRGRVRTSSRSELMGVSGPMIERQLWKRPLVSQAYLSRIRGCPKADACCAWVPLRARLPLLARRLQPGSGPPLRTERTDPVCNHCRA